MCESCVWRWPLTVVEREPPSRQALCERLRLSPGDLVASFGNVWLSLLAVLDADGAVVSEFPCPSAFRDQYKLAMALGVLDEHPSLRMPGGLRITPHPDPDEWAYTIERGPTPASEWRHGD